MTLFFFLLWDTEKEGKKGKKKKTNDVVTLMPDTFPVYVACVQDAEYSTKPFHRATVTADYDRREVTFDRRFSFGRMSGRSIGRDVCLIYTAMRRNADDHPVTDYRGVLLDPFIYTYTTRTNENYHAILIGIVRNDTMTSFMVLDDRNNDYAVTMWLFPIVKTLPRAPWSEELLQSIFETLSRVCGRQRVAPESGLYYAQTFIRTGKLLKRLRPLHLFVHRLSRWPTPMTTQRTGLSIENGSFIVKEREWNTWSEDSDEYTLGKHYAPVICRFVRAEGKEDVFPVFPESTGVLVHPLMYEHRLAQRKAVSATVDPPRWIRSHHLVAAYRWGENETDSVFLWVIRQWEQKQPTYIRSVIPNVIVLSDSKFTHTVPEAAVEVIERMEREGYERHPELWAEGCPEDTDGEPSSKQRRIHR